MTSLRSTALHFAPFCSLLLLLTFGAAAAAQTTTVIRPGAYGAKDWRENGLAPADLPTTGNRLWAVRLASDLHLYAWNGTTWVDLTTSGTVGPQGPQGIQGPQGPQGTAGAQGATGPQGPQGNPGAAGASGPAGATWLSGSAAPTSGQGTDGDFYFRTTGEVYGKAAGAWSLVANIAGPAGPTGTAGPAGADGSPGPAGPAGPQGPAGATGPQGPAGAAGVAGADGKTVRNGSGAPSSGLGVDGDFYVDSTAHAIYGPKTAGAWGASTSLVGPPGATGATGATGPQGPAGSVSSLTSDHILVGDASNLPADVALSGDVSITNTGVSKVVALSPGTSASLLFNTSGFFYLGGTTSAFPAFARKGQYFTVELADDSAAGPIKGSLLDVQSGSVSSIAAVARVNGTSSSGRFELNATGEIEWASNSTLGTPGSEIYDTGFNRVSPGVIKVTDGGAGAGTFQFGDPGTKPTCDSSIRGRLWIDFGGAGVADTVEICAKDILDAYAWRSLI